MYYEDPLEHENINPRIIENAVFISNELLEDINSILANNDCDGYNADEFEKRISEYKKAHFDVDDITRSIADAYYNVATDIVNELCEREPILKDFLELSVTSPYNSYDGAMIVECSDGNKLVSFEYGGNGELYDKMCDVEAAKILDVLLEKQGLSLDEKDYDLCKCDINTTVDDLYISVKECLDYVNDGKITENIQATIDAFAYSYSEIQQKKKDYKKTERDAL